MAIIQSGASSNLWTIDSSGAGRAVLYAPDGTVINPTPAGSYICGVNQRHTAAVSAGAFVLELRGPPTLTARLRRVTGSLAFDGTAVAASNVTVGLFRGTGASTASGGTPQSPSKKIQSMSASTLTDFRYATAGTGLTTTGISYESNPVWSAGLPTAVTNGIFSFALDFEKVDHRNERAVELGPNDHLALKMITASIIGFHTDLTFDWDEV